jgi:uncharacterized protein YbjT (DUF2867 family)
VILAAGATGRLRPVVEALLAHGHELRVTARDPEATSADDLARRGAEIVRANLDDQRSLVQAARGVATVFAAGSPHGAGPAGETRHGINIAEAAVAAGVRHLVFSSGAGAERPTGVAVLDSKYAVEQRIRELGLRHAILAPVYFMQNAFNPLEPRCAGGRPVSPPAAAPSLPPAGRDRGPRGSGSRRARAA